MKLPGKSYIAVLLSFPSSLIIHRALLDTTSMSAKSRLQQKLSSPPPRMSCPPAFVPELGCVMGEVDPSSRLEVLKAFKSALCASVSSG